jgi:hypothetical protein
MGRHVRGGGQNPLLRFVNDSLVQGFSANTDFSQRLDALKELQEGRGFSPAEITAPTVRSSRAPHSPDVSGLYGARDTRIIRNAL